MKDTIYRADAIEAVQKKLQDWCGYAFEDYRRGLYEAQDILEALPSADAVSREDYHNLLTASDDIDRALREYQAKGEQPSAEVAQKIDHDRDWIIGCIQHDGFIHTHRFDKANQIILEALSAEAVQGEWIEVEVLPEVYDIEGVKTWGSKMQCDQCGFRHTAIEGRMAQYNFCPNCGADMRKEKE